MAQATILSYEQLTPFVAKHPLPDSPHKNLRMREALDLAKQWGCKMRFQGSDMNVSHPIVAPERTPVVVSTHRTDTTQALVSFIRKAEEGTRRHPIYLQSIPLDDRPLRGGLEHVNNGAVKVHTEPVAEEEVEAKPEPKPEVRPSLNWEQYADDAGSFFAAQTEFFHYRKHCTDDKMVLMADCQDPVCKMAREHLEHIGFLGDVANELFTQLEDAKRDLGISKASILMLQEQIEKQEAEESKPVVVQPAQGANQMPPDMAGRQRLIRRLHSELFYDMKPHWPGASATFTRMSTALEKLAHKEQWSEELLGSYQRLDFRMWQGQVMSFKGEGVRNLIGNSGWNDFETAMNIVKNNREAGR